MTSWLSPGMRDIYRALMIPENTPSNEAVRVVKDLMDRVPVGRSFQERVAWCLNVPRDSSDEHLFAEVCRIKAEFKKAHADWFQLFEENKALRERLQFDPGGSDRIDELEDCVEYLRDRIRHLENLADEQADVYDWCVEKGWQKDGTPRQFVQQLLEASFEDAASLNRVVAQQEAQLRRIQTGQDIESDCLTETECKQQAQIAELQLQNERLRYDIVEARGEVAWERQLKEDFRRKLLAMECKKEQT